MNALEHARPGDERTQDGEGERGTQQRQVPHPKHPAPLLHHHRMQVGGTRQPRQQRCVFHRVPAPVPAPAQHLVGPPRTQDDAGGEKTPCHQCPAAGLDQPPFTQPAGDQRPDGEGERHSEPHVPEVEHGRMERHEDVFLQQRVGPRTVKPRRWVERPERIGRADNQEEKEHCHHEHRHHGPAHQRVVDAVAEPAGDKRHETGQDENPQQDRPFQGRPQRGHVERERGRSGTVLGHERHREVVGQQGVFHGPHRQHRTSHHPTHTPLTDPQIPGVVGVDPHQHRQHAPQRSHKAERHPGASQRQAHAPAAAAGEALAEPYPEPSSASSSRPPLSAM